MEPLEILTYFRAKYIMDLPPMLWPMQAAFGWLCCSRNRRTSSLIALEVWTSEWGLSPWFRLSIAYTYGKEFLDIIWGKPMENLMTHLPGDFPHQSPANSPPILLGTEEPMIGHQRWPRFRILPGVQVEAQL